MNECGCGRCLDAASSRASVKSVVTLPSVTKFTNKSTEKNSVIKITILE